MGRSADLAAEADRLARQERVADGTATPEEEAEDYFEMVMARDD